MNGLELSEHNNLMPFPYESLTETHNKVSYWNWFTDNDLRRDLKWDKNSQISALALLSNQLGKSMVA